MTELVWWGGLIRNFALFLIPIVICWAAARLFFQIFKFPNQHPDFSKNAAACLAAIFLLLTWNLIDFAWGASSFRVFFTISGLALVAHLPLVILAIFGAFYFWKVSRGKVTFSHRTVYTLYGLTVVAQFIYAAFINALWQQLGDRLVPYLI